MHESLLAAIESPEDLKRLDSGELTLLAAEIRRRIIEVLSVKGGHLASNLGTIELTLALHSVFSSPEDKFIWDVSHQTYTHKIITGRNARFEKIRQFKGLGGFSNPEESSHDHFHAGHAGTAVSLSLGVAKNRDLTKRKEHIISIIGDASLTCGLTLEALNNVKRDLSRFIIVLNDNAMSISENVGAIKNLLSRLLNNPTSNKLYKEMESLVSKLPGYGQILAHTGQKLTESVKNLVSPAAFFASFGLSYVGPIDGHDIKKLIETLEALKNGSEPVLLHVLTQKGKGMEEAMKNPITYHGAKPFSRDTGKFLADAGKLTFPKIFGKHILKMAENDPSLVTVTPAMSAGSCLDAFMQKFPERCLDVGIAEGHAVTYCGGIAYGGQMKVVACVYATFLQRALDNVFHDVCLQELPVVFALDRGGLAGPDGATHNGIYDIAFLNTMPNMVICQPRNGQMLKELMESAFSWNCPTAIRYPNMVTEDSDYTLAKQELGKGEVLAEGNDILIIGLGHMCLTALKVREALAKEGISACVMDPIFVKPLDKEQLSHLLKTHRRLVTIEEHSLAGGMGSIINNFLMTNGFQNTRVLNLGIPEIFVHQGSHAELTNELGLTPEKITKSILEHFLFAKATQSSGQSKRKADLEI